MECSVINGISVSHLLSKVQDYHKRRSEKIVRARGWGGLEWNSVLWTGQHSCTHELTTAVAVCTKPAQDKNQYYNQSILQHGGGGFRSPHPYLKSFGQLMASRGGRVSFLGYGPW